VKDANGTVNDFKSKVSNMVAAQVKVQEELWRVFPKSPRTTCSCGRQLHGRTISMYRHPDGWETDDGRMWIYVTCLCGHDMAIWKMGIPRDYDFRTAIQTFRHGSMTIEEVSL